jgi:hypothetical protein
MKLVDLSLARFVQSTSYRAFNGLADLVAFRYLFHLDKNYDVGRFRKVVVRLVTETEVDRDRALLNVLSVEQSFDFDAFENLSTQAEKERFLLTVLHQRMLLVAKTHGFESVPLEIAFKHTMQADNTSIFPLKWKASFPKPYRSARLGFRCVMPDETEIFALVKQARGVEGTPVRLKTLHTNPSMLGYHIRRIEWANETDLVLTEIGRTKDETIVFSLGESA